MGKFELRQFFYNASVYHVVVFGEDLLEFSAPFGQSSVRFVGDQNGFENLGAAAAAFEFGPVAGLFYDLENMIAGPAPNTVGQLAFPVDQSDSAGISLQPGKLHFEIPGKLGFAFGEFYLQSRDLKILLPHFLFKLFKFRSLNGKLPFLFA